MALLQRCISCSVRFYLICMVFLPVLLLPAFSAIAQQPVRLTNQLSPSKLKVSPAADCAFDSELESADPDIEPSAYSPGDLTFSDLGYDTDWVRDDLGLVFDFQSNRKIISLSQGPHDKKGYRVSSQINIESGVSVGWSRSLIGSSARVGIGIGIVPISGLSAYHVAHLDSHAAALTLARPRLPIERKELLRWREGDSLSLSMTGGIGYFASIGISIASTEILYLKTGTFELSFERGDASTLYVEISDIELRSLTNSLNGTIFFSAGKNQYLQRNQSHSFSLDLSTKEGAKALSFLMNGRVSDVQKMLNRNSVQQVERRRSEKFGKSKSVYIGIPFLLNASSSQGTVVKSDRVINFNQSKAGPAKLYRTATFIENKSRQLLLKTRKSALAFSVAIEKNKSSLAAPMNHHGAAILWKYQNDEASIDDIRRDSRTFRVVTGRSISDFVKLPARAKTGYVELEIRMNISRRWTKELTRSVLAISKAGMENLALAKVRRFFVANSSAVDDLCRDYLPIPTDLGESLSAAHSDCASLVQAEVLGSLRKLRQAAKSLGRSQTDEEFLKHYLELGENLLANQFVFQVAASLGKIPFSVSASLAGEYFNRQCLRKNFGGAKTH